MALVYEWASTRDPAEWPAPPEGDGRPAMLIPGFLAGDPSLSRMARWLRAGDWATVRSGVRWNVDCMEATLGRLENRLEAAVAQKKAALRLEVGGNRLGAGWLPVATIELRERMKISEDAFEVHPGTSAMGLVPDGLLQAMRPEIYAASEAGRRIAGR